MKKITIIIILACLAQSCENADEFSPSSLIELMTLNVRDDNTSADGVSRVSVVVSFEREFSTEDDQKIDFVVFKDSLENSSQELVFTSNNGIEQRISELFVVHNKAETIKVKATASVNGNQFSRTTNIRFQNAFPDEINVYSDSLVINPQSFRELKITTELLRPIGLVNAGIQVETVVTDTLGRVRGLFNNYQNRTKSGSDRVVNKFTLGNEDYTGKLYLIASCQTATEILRDTTVIFSKNN